MARKKPAAGPRKGRARAAAEPAADEGLDIEEIGKAKTAKPPMAIESALVLVTFIALAAAFLLIQVKMHDSFGKGWPV